MLKKVLIIWEQISEVIELYCVDITSDELDFLWDADGKYINVDESNLAMDCLNMAFTEVDADVAAHWNVPEKAKTWLGRFVGSKLTDPDRKQNVTFDAILKSGVWN